MDSFIQEIFYKKPVVEGSQSSEEIVIDQMVKIEILNGGAPSGTAGDLKEIIERDGYDVVKVANYKGEDKEDVTIYAKDTSKAEQFRKYFDNCTIMTDSAMEKGVDIQIIIGTKGI